MRFDTRRFAARVANLPVVTEYVAGCAERTGLDARARFPVLLALEEAFVNVCRYAYPGGTGDVELACGHDGGVFVIELADTGVEFDVLSQTTPDLSAGIDERPLGGLGVHLIRSVAKAVRYRRDGGRNILRMEFPRTTGIEAG